MLVGVAVMVEVVWVVELVGVVIVMLVLVDHEVVEL